MYRTLETLSLFLASIVIWCLSHLPPRSRSVDSFAMRIYCQDYSLTTLENVPGL